MPKVFCHYKCRRLSLVICICRIKPPTFKQDNTNVGVQTFGLLHLYYPAVNHLQVLSHRRYRRCSLFRLLHFLFSQRASPGSTQEWEKPAVNSIVASDTPGQDQEYGKSTNDRVDTDSACQHEVHVHEHSEESGNTG